MKRYLRLILVLIVFTCTPWASNSIPLEKKIGKEDTVLIEKSQIEVRQFAEIIKDKTGLVSRIESNKTEVISDGLTYTRIVYRNKNNKRTRLYVLFADMDKGVGLVATAAKNGVDLNAKEIVSQQVRRVQNRGYNILAAVNGDFWKENKSEIDGTPLGQPYGALYMEGMMYKDITRDSPYYFAAILKEGHFIMGNKARYGNIKRCIKEAIGGQHLLVEDGKDVSFEIDDQESLPRTSIGTFGSDKIIFIVADGEEFHSDGNKMLGVTIQDLGKIYEALGVETAINLDGNSSTTLITKNRNGSLSVKNRLSNGNEKPVANAWVVVKK